MPYNRQVRFLNDRPEHGILDYGIMLALFAMVTVGAFLAFANDPADRVTSASQAAPGHGRSMVATDRR